MPKRAKELTAAAVAKLREPGRYPVGGCEGLHLRITPAGTRLWVLRIVIGEWRRDLGLGNFEDVSLSQARDAGRDARRAVKAGIDPTPPKLVPAAPPKARHLFRDVAAELIESKKGEWKNKKHLQQWQNSLDTYAYPLLGGMDVADIKLTHVVQVLQPIWSTITESATRLRSRIEAVIDYATVHEWREGDNPARWKGLLDKVLPAPEKVSKPGHHEALPIDDAPAFMKTMELVDGVSALALRLLILTAARSVEIRFARWSEFDLQKRVWVVPGDRMKAGLDHTVPLSDQAVALLSSIPHMADTEYLFPTNRTKKGQPIKPISDMAMTEVMRRQGLTAVPHGFRSTFRDWGGDYTEYHRDLLEAALAHVPENKTEAAYRRLTAVQKRRVLMQDWANFLLAPPASTRRAAKPQAQTRAKPQREAQ